MPASGYTAITFVANEQPTTAKWNLIGSNDASFNNGNGFNDGILATRHYGANSVTSEKLFLTNVQATFSSVSLTSAKKIVGTYTPPANGKYWIVGNFIWTHSGVGSIRDYTCTIEVGATMYRRGIITSMSGSYVHNISLVVIIDLTTSDTVNFAVTRATDNGGTLISDSGYTIMKIG